MIRALALSAALIGLACAARAQDGRPAEASPEMLSAALQAAIAQRDQALNEGLRLAAQASLARAEIARLREALKAASAPPAPSPAP
ncbi:hypothetical protein [Methylobacterium frigidaeris]|uniref:DUF4398 domain-containing protein n=1 Tax=Methylobacterium frigidaeris TaxID=2038277 RepID=A0AA37HG87_9HYPH|nr:hypothetical protein [Methylobacterium frigidaeris]PIK74804.1 hypothetical protein CS379_00460 [Methylobacterium frigidaeris]GJD65188.1 hypothetical protein MPEAHAMD_5375 [Methylobacterium frigidaeris]